MRKLINEWMDLKYLWFVFVQVHEEELRSNLFYLYTISVQNFILLICIQINLLKEKNIFLRLNYLLQKLHTIVKIKCLKNEKKWLVLELHFVIDNTCLNTTTKNCIFNFCGCWRHTISSNLHEKSNSFF